MSRRSRKSFEGWRRRYVGDLRHALRCCQAGRLPAEIGEYLEGILADEDWLPKPSEVAERMGLTYAQQQANHLYTIPVIDKTEEELAELRKAKVRERKKMKRSRDRAKYLAEVASRKPWIAAGLKERTWYRHRAKAAAATVVGPHPLPSQQVAEGRGPRIYIRQSRTLCHAELSSAQGSLDQASPTSLAPLVANCVGNNARRLPRDKKEKPPGQTDGFKTRNGRVNHRGNLR